MYLKFNWFTKTGFGRRNWVGNEMTLKPKGTGHTSYMWRGFVKILLKKDVKTCQNHDSKQKREETKTWYE